MLSECHFNSFLRIISSSSKCSNTSVTLLLTYHVPLKFPPAHYSTSKTRMTKLQDLRWVQPDVKMTITSKNRRHFGGYSLVSSLSQHCSDKTWNCLFQFGYQKLNRIQTLCSYNALWAIQKIGWVYFMPWRKVQFIIYGWKSVSVQQLHTIRDNSGLISVWLLNSSYTILH